jgi:hypothetical protein
MNTIESTKTCVECQGRMSPVIDMDKTRDYLTNRADAGPLEYRLPEDRLKFWTGKYPTAGPVQAFMCEGCGRIALYGCKPDP